jgi:hypothetical protein
MAHGGTGTGTTIIITTIITTITIIAGDYETPRGAIARRRSI